MPLVAHSNLPTFNRLKQEGSSVLPPSRADHQDIRELHIGLLNMMPDSALAATERQFFRLVGESNQIAQFYIHPFTLNEIPRSAETRTYIEKFYEPFSALQKTGLDALIITGANVSQPDLAAEPFWKPLIKVIDWAYENVTSTLCSCLATHSVLQLRHNIKRKRLPQKRWGVYQHEILNQQHPLIKDINTRLDVPHSRYNEITRKQFEQAKLPILIESATAGVHLAVSEDLFRIVYFQGHPEYDTISLLKEYKREVSLFHQGHCDDYPPYPEYYFCRQTQAILKEHQQHVTSTKHEQAPLPNFPDQIITSRLHNTWHDTAEAVLNNWIGTVYQLTNQDRTLPYMDGIDPDNPLKLR